MYMGLARHLSCRGVVFMGKAWPVMLTWILKSLSSIIKVWGMKNLLHTCYLACGGVVSYHTCGYAFC